MNELLIKAGSALAGLSAGWMITSFTLEPRVVAMEHALMRIETRLDKAMEQRVAAAPSPQR